MSRERRSGGFGSVRDKLGRHMPSYLSERDHDAVADATHDLFVCVNVRLNVK